MSSLMVLSIEKKKDILENLKVNRSKKFNKELIKIDGLVQKYSFLKEYERKLQDLKYEFIQKLNEISIEDVDWERHEKKGAEIEKKYNEKLLEIKYEINSLLHQYNSLKKLYNEYRKIFDKLKEEIEKDEKVKKLISNLNMFELLKNPVNATAITEQINQIKYEIKNLENIMEKANILSAYDLDKLSEREFKKSNKLEEVLENIKIFSKNEYERIKGLNVNEDFKLTEAKVIYQRLFYTKLYKEEIDTILEELPNDLAKKFEKLKQKEIIYKSEYEKLMNEYYNQKSSLVSIDKITKAFEEMGYSFEEVAFDKKGYIDTDNPEYKIAYRIENNKLILAFTRFVDKKVKINEYEREKDRKMAKKWCNDFEKISKLLEKEGIKFKKEMIEEPEKVDIRYEKHEEVKKESNIKGKYYKKSNS